eukprot:CAMPEP_0197033606 /NCGR_PEP_ID=MMETSP1384-20130603/11977_1 /TAXON_ID=29189 /ORGANISM="Ammonia sp." /LENGTH=611 /DNA_ID=CAMNT_0042463445 /DNA_START=89 /DNA_END=1924 /DNA_ORIENTATION=-
MQSVQTLSTQIQEIIGLLDNSNTNTNNQQIRPATKSKPKQFTELKTNEDDNDANDELGGAWDGRPKTARGTRDYNPGDMIIREQMMSSIKRNFTKFGGQFMETPVFELRDILMDKYGEDEKLIYDLAKQEAETLCLRYDLTVPLARYVAMNRKDIKSPFKAARVGRVYRRDQPYMSKGRLREFWQCDFDIIRTAEPQNKLDLILDDMETVALTIQQLRDLIGDCFVLLINNRKLLDTIMDICKVPTDKIKAISSAIDKLDKKDWECVKEEMIEKGIDGETAEMLRRFTEINGTPDEVLTKLRNDKYLKQRLENNDVSTIQALQEFDLLLSFVKSYNSDLFQFLRIDMSMVRGLDYYTGIIMEAQFADKEIASQYGSIAGGGRYDKLVSRFVTSDKEQYPCVGSSIGFERIFSYLKNTRGINVGVQTDVLVCEATSKSDSDASGYGLYAARLQLLQELRLNTSMNVEIMSKLKPGFRDQIDYAESREIKWMIILGESEIQNNTVNLRRLFCKGDIVLTKDAKRGRILEVITTSKQPQFKCEPVDEAEKDKKKKSGKKAKDWILNKKQIKSIIQNGVEITLPQIEGLPRNELLPFFIKVGQMNANDNTSNDSK